MSAELIGKPIPSLKSLLLDTVHRGEQMSLESSLVLEMRAICKQVKSAVEAVNAQSPKVYPINANILALIGENPYGLHLSGLADLTLSDKQPVKVHQQTENGTCETVILQDQTITNVQLNSQGFFTIPAAVSSFRMRLLFTTQSSPSDERLVKAVCEMGLFDKLGERLQAPHNHDWITAKF